MKRWRVGNLKKLRFSRWQILSWIGWTLLVAISMVAAAYAVATAEANAKMMCIAMFRSYLDDYCYWRGGLACQTINIGQAGWRAAVD